MSKAIDSADESTDARGRCPNCGSTSPGVTARGPGDHRTTCCGENVADWHPAWRSP